jgi:hypothetical protein
MQLLENMRHTALFRMRITQVDSFIGAIVLGSETFLAPTISELVLLQFSCQPCAMIWRRVTDSQMQMAHPGLAADGSPSLDGVKG